MHGECRLDTCVENAPNVGYLAFCVGPTPHFSLQGIHEDFRHLPKRSRVMFGVEHVNFRVGRMTTPKHNSVNQVHKSDIML